MAEDGERGPSAMARAKGLLDSFLTDRPDRTLQAYTIDLEDFARFQGATQAAAAARLVAAGPAAAWRLVLEYGMDLRRRGRAPATIDRRLNTLRALVRDANHQGLVEWQLELPTADQISTAIESLPAKDSEHYLFPRHLGEIDRLDIQHYALRETLRANHLAPVENPERVLDVGSGTGQWGFEICELFDAALVVGLDLVPGKPGQPPRYRYVRGNVLQGLPFADDQFDFVHQRMLVSGVPVSSWPAAIADLSRVTRPGGWVELVEMAYDAERPGPAARRLMDLARPLLAALALDTTNAVYRSLDAYLREAGLTNVVRREAAVPVGRWGGEIGSLMVTTVRAGATRVCEVLQARGMLSGVEARALLQEASTEWESGRMAYRGVVAFGQNPPG
jgi:ubiquinone/menaquinone biosynthesis C-methylase UbiE